MRINKLDGLRGVFSLLVVLYHFSPVLLSQQVHDYFFIRQSRCFVDFFFVLSGYVIAVNYNHAIVNVNLFFTYINKRFIRLYPLLLYTTFVVLFYEIIYNNFLVQYVKVENQTLSSHLFIRTLDTLLFTNATPILGSTYGMNLPAWSISSEMISYIIFGIVSLYAVGKRKNILLLLIIIGCFAFSIYHQQYFFTSSFGFVRGLICFSLGYFVFKFSSYSFSLNKNLELLIPFILLAIFYQLNTYPIGAKRELFGLFSIPLFFALAILVLLKTNGRLSQFLETKPLQFLGKISYSIYLNHTIVIYIFPGFTFFVLKKLNMDRTPFTNTLTLLITFLLIIIYSKYTQQLIEKKGGKLLERFLIKQPPLANKSFEPIVF